MPRNSEYSGEHSAFDHSVPMASDRWDRELNLAAILLFSSCTRIDEFRWGNPENSQLHATSSMSLTINFACVSLLDFVKITSAVMLEVESEAPFRPLFQSRRILREILARAYARDPTQELSVPRPSDHLSRCLHRIPGGSRHLLGDWRL